MPRSGILGHLAGHGIVEERVDRNRKRDADDRLRAIRGEQRSLNGPIVCGGRRVESRSRARRGLRYSPGTGSPLTARTTRRRTRGRRQSRERVRVVEGQFGRELIVDGSFASFYRPGSPVTGSVWDAIAAPLLALPAERCRSVLILGLGGGSAARIVRALAPGARIVGVEFDPAVVRAARDHFDLNDLNVEVVLADALVFLRGDERYYDAVLEDVFVGAGDAVQKPGWLPRPGLELAAERLVPGGVLVSNTLDEAQPVSKVLRKLFPEVLRIDVEDYDNRIFAAGFQLGNAADLRARVGGSAVLGETVSRLSFRTLKTAAQAPSGRTP